MEADALAGRIGSIPARARELLDAHRRTYHRFWQWSDGVFDFAMFCGHLFTVFGWPLQVERSPNVRSLRNFPMQGNGAEMLRLACCLATERGVSVCAPVHDALLIEADVSGIREAVTATQQAMIEAGSVVLGGLELRVDAKVVAFPERYSDARGARMWQLATELANERDEVAHAAS
jgi:hypothetical protein